MLGTVHVDEGLDVHAELAAPFDLSARQEDGILRVPEERVVPFDLGDVRMARDGAERDVALDLDARQRIGLA